jgi:DNA-binding NarL/FixJ family response regulator
MLASRIQGPAESAGLTLTPVLTAAELESALLASEDPVVLLDLAGAAFPFAETLSLVRRLAPASRTIGIYPHVDPELGRAGQAAGCDVVMPRSRFFTNITASLTEALPRSTADTEQLSASTPEGESR